MLIKKISEALTLAQTKRSPSVVVLSALLRKLKKLDEHDKEINPSNFEVITAIQIAVFQLSEKLEKSNNTDKMSAFEIEVLSSFLPAHLSPDEINSEISKFLKERSAAGLKTRRTSDIINHFDRTHTGKFDHRALTILIKGL